MESGKTSVTIKMSLHVKTNVSPESQPVSGETHQITCKGRLKKLLFNVTLNDTGNHLSGKKIASFTVYELLIIPVERPVPCRSLTGRSFCSLNIYFWCSLLTYNILHQQLIRFIIIGQHESINMCPNICTWIISTMYPSKPKMNRQKVSVQKFNETKSLWNCLFIIHRLG